MNTILIRLNEKEVDRLLKGLNMLKSSDDFLFTMELEARLETADRIIKSRDAADEDERKLTAPFELYVSE